MPRPSSDSWQYFKLLTDEQGKTKKARCTFCGLEKAASITRLHQHLLYRCSQITPELRDQLRQQRDETSQSNEPMGRPFESSPASPKQTTSQFRDQRSQAMLDWYLARAFFSASIPFEAIEDPHMVTFLRQLGYVPPPSHRLQQYLLKEQHWDLIKRNEPEIIQPLFTRPSFIPETSLSTTTREEEDDEEEGNL